MTPVAHVKWTRGGEATITRVAGDLISLSSSIPSPPGSSLEGTLDIRGDLENHDTRPPEGRAARSLCVKVSGSKKQPDGRFVIDGRCLNMPKELRIELEAATAKSPAK